MWASGQFHTPAALFPGKEPSKLSFQAIYLHRQFGHFLPLTVTPVLKDAICKSPLLTTLSEHSGRIQPAAATAATLTPVMFTNGQTESEYRYM
jgi:hypothetical protein